MKRILKSKEGFTLIELLVVIAIIGVLAAVVLLAINPAAMLRRGRDSNRESDLTTLRKAIDLYMASSSNPSEVPGGDGPAGTGVDVDSEDAIGTLCAAADTNRDDADKSGWLIPATAGAWTCTDHDPDLSEWVSAIPLDPTSSDMTDDYRYRYQTNSDGDKYSLTAKREDNPSATNCFQAGTYVPASYCW